MTPNSFVLASIDFTLGDVEANAQRMQAIVQENQCSQWVIFPEMSLTGYPLDDFIHHPNLPKAVEHHAHLLIKASTSSTVVFGLPVWSLDKTKCYNALYVAQGGRLVHVHHKRCLADSGPFYESRFFSVGNTQPIWVNEQGQRILLMICEEMWCSSYWKKFSAPIDLVVVVNASYFQSQKIGMRAQQLEKIQRHLNAPVLYVNAVGGQDDLVFDGHNMCVDHKRCLVSSGFRNAVDSLILNQATWSVPTHWESDLSSTLEDLYDACVLGLSDYFKKNNIQKAVLGVSGGVDSALVLCMLREFLEPNCIIAVNMPTRHNGKQGQDDAQVLCNHLSVDLVVKNIEPIYTVFLDTLSLQDTGEIVTQNLQARIRGNCLMAYANQHGGLLVSTSNKSEIGFGYTTLYGDSCGGYAPIKDVNKTQVYRLAQLKNRCASCIPLSIIQAAPSAELAPNQTDQDHLPDYAVMDNILYQYLLNDPRYSGQQKWRNTIQNMEYKRQQMPIGPIVSSQSFGKDRLFPLTVQVPAFGKNNS